MQNVVKLFPTENPSALIDRAALTEAIGLLARLCTDAQPGPMHIRLASKPGGMALTSTNFTVQAETAIPADVDARFSAALPAATLLKLLRKGGASETVLLELLADTEELEGERFIPAKCMVRLGAASFTLDATGTDEFPEPILLDPDDDVQGFDIPAAVLWNAIDGTLDAASREETRHYLGGIYLHNHNGRLRFVATDGHRLYMQDTFVHVGKAEIAGIIPRDAAQFIAALIDGYASADPVSVRMTASLAELVYRDVAVSLRLVDGTFPDYLRVIPANPPTAATVLGVDLAAAVASLVECTAAITVKLDFAADAVTVHAGGAAGEGTTSVSCSLEGEPLSIGFSAKNLRSVIEAASPDGRRMTIRMADAVSPALVTGSIGGWTGVLMPAAM